MISRLASYFIIMKKLAVLISNAGSGTNLQAIIDAIQSGKLKAQIKLIVSSDANALGLERAKKNNLKTLIVNKKDDLKNIFDKYKIDFIALAGWKLIIPESLINEYPNRILNLHPGLIPEVIDGVVKNPDGTDGLWNRGMLTDIAIKNFLDKKATYTGSTAHFLSNEFDFGKILNRCFEKILPDDTVKSLYMRLKKKENQIYVESLIKLCNQN